MHTTRVRDALCVRDAMCACDVLVMCLAAASPPRPLALSGAVAAAPSRVDQNVAIGIATERSAATRPKDAPGAAALAALAPAGAAVLVAAPACAAGGETVILLRPPLPLVGVSMRVERGCQQSGSPVDGYLGRCCAGRRRRRRRAPWSAWRGRTGRTSRTAGCCCSAGCCCRRPLRRQGSSPAGNRSAALCRREQTAELKKWIIPQSDLPTRHRHNKRTHTRPCVQQQCRADRWPRWAVISESSSQALGRRLGSATMQRWQRIASQPEVIGAV